MNLKLAILSLLIGTLFLSEVSAQKGKDTNKAEEKEWAKKLKALKPMEYKTMVEEQEALRSRSSSLSSEIDELKSEIDPLKNQLKNKNQELENLQSKVTELQNQLEQVNNKNEVSAMNNSSKTSSRATSAPIKGLVYKVQIGAFKNKDLTKYFDNNPNFSGEVDSDGTKKYTLGAFEDYWEADNFKKYLREMGVTDAWIVAYKDGVRVNLKDAREGVL